MTYLMEQLHAKLYDMYELHFVKYPSPHNHEIPPIAVSFQGNFPLNHDYGEKEHLLNQSLMMLMYELQLPQTVCMILPFATYVRQESTEQ